MMPSSTNAAYAERAFKTAVERFGAGLAKSISENFFKKNHYTFDSSGSLIIVGKPVDKLTQAAVPAVSLQVARRSRLVLMVAIGIASKLTACRVSPTGALTLEATRLCCKFGDASAVRMKDVVASLGNALRDTTRLAVEEMNGEEIWRMDGFRVLFLDGRRCLVTERKNLFRFLPSFDLKSCSEALEVCLPAIASLEEHMIELPGKHIFCLPDGISTLTLEVVLD
jgi:hypothetical protein